MKILVTGACGYIGSVLCPTLEKAGHEVEKFDSVLGNDVTNVEEVMKACERNDSIAHLAAVVGMESVDKDPELARKVNVHGATNVCSSGKKVVFASVLGSYGNYEIVTEETPTSPKHDYFQQKLEAEESILIVPGNVALRFGSLYGCSPKMRWDLLVHNLIREGMDSGVISLYESGVTRALTNIKDVVESVMFALSTKSISGVFNIVSTNISKRELAGEIAKVIGCQVERIDEEDTEGRNYAVSTDKIENLGFVFHPNLAASIEEIWKLRR